MQFMNKQQGSAAVMGMGVMLFLLIIIGGLVPMVATEVKSLQSNHDVVEAQYVAEAGAKRAIVGFMNKRADWAWANGFTRSSFQDSTNKKYSVSITSESITPAVTDGLAPSAGEYIIHSTGYVGNVSKQVSVRVKVENSGNQNASGDVFGKYVVFAKQNASVEGYGSPSINGAMGLAGDNVNIANSTNFLKDKVYVKKFPAGWRGWPVDWLTSEWYVIDPVVGTLSVKMPDMPTMPTIPTIQPPGSTLLTTSITNLSDTTYYYNGSYTRGGNITSTIPETTLYINGGLHLTSQGKGKPYGSISSTGDITLYVNGSINLSNGSYISSSNGNIAIYATGEVSLSGASYIKSDNGNVSIKANQGINLTDSNNYIQAATTGNINLYSLQNSINLSNDCYVNGGTAVLQANNDVNFANSSSVNKSNSYSSALAYVYAAGSTFTNTVTMGGKASLVITTGPFNINSSVNAPYTVFVSTSGQTSISNSPIIGGIYTNGTLNITNSPKISYNSEAMKALGLDGSGSGGSTVVNSWSGKFH